MKIKARKRRKGQRRRGPKYWIVAMGTMGMLVAFTVGNSHAIALGRAPLGRDVAVQGQKESRFDIPAGTLEEVLISFQRLSGLQVVIPNEAMKPLASPGVSGVYSIEQALKQILKGTGISYRFSDPKTVILEIRADSESVEIRDDSKIQAASTKYTEPLLDTPQTIMSFLKK